MVQFGRRLQALRYEPWEPYYLDYTKLKGALEDTDGGPTERISPAKREREFVRLLNEEIQKSSLFFLHMQGSLANSLASLQGEQQNCTKQIQELLKTTNGQERSGGSQVLVESFRTKLRDLRESYRGVGEYLAHLMHFVELTVTGLRKILKKHDKIFKSNKLSDRYLTEHFWDAEDSYLRPLFHYEGFGALVLTLKESFSELKTLEGSLSVVSSDLSMDTGLDSATSAGHRRRQTAPVLVVPPPVEQQMQQPERHHGRTRTADDTEDWDKIFALRGEPILLKIDAARRRLRESSNFVSLLAASAMMGEGISDEDAGALDAYPRPKVSRISSCLNLMSTFLYMTNYYIVAPTSGTYATKLGGNPSLAGIIIGMTPIAALLSTVLYSWWTSHSYKAALIFASGCSVIGNALYALGLPYESLTLVLVGRLLNGFGSARAINRRYIADSFSREERTAASAAFVTAGALGMAAGPAMAAGLDMITPEDEAWWSVENAPGWIMFGAWLVYLICLVFYFRDPPKLMEAPTPTKSADIEMTGETKALLSGVEATDSASPPIYKNTPVVVTLVVYFTIKLALECALSSTATLTAFYFGWGPQSSGMYLALLGLIMFPANLLVAYFSRQYDDRELIMATLVLLLAGLWGIVDYGLLEYYSVAQYVIFGVIIFVSSNAVEGPNMALLSKTIPKSWARGLFNVGLLSTEAGTLGRAIGDVFITWCGLGGLEKLLNHMFVTLGVLVGATVAVTYQAYPFLEPLDKDD